MEGQVIAKPHAALHNAPEAFVTTAGSPQTSSDLTGNPSSVEEQVIPVLAEQISVQRRCVETGRVMATITTQSREQIIQEDLVRDTVEVERVPVGRAVESIPPVREEGDTTIIPVVEEVLVIERRLILKEEVHLRRARIRQTHAATVVTRSQDVVVTRSEQHPPQPAEPAVADHSDGHSNAEGTSR
jgi:stress response protein YsnF